MQQAVAFDVAPRNGATADEIVSFAEAARRLKIHRSSVMRYCNEHGAECGVVGKGQVRLAMLAAHRGDNITVENSETSERRSPAAHTPVRDSKARLESAKATEAELNLQQRLGTLTEVAGVQGAVEDLLMVLRDSLLNVDFALAERVIACKDPLEAQAMIRAANQTALTETARQLAQRAAGGEKAVDEAA